MAGRGVPRDSMSPPGASQKYMDQAFAMRRLATEQGDQSYGAVIVLEEDIVGRAPSRVVVANDPTAHAEMEAIRDAAQQLGTRSLDGCTMYSSSRPCPMCEAAAYWAGIDRRVFGAGMEDGGVPKLRRC